MGPSSPKIPDSDHTLAELIVRLIVRSLMRNCICPSVFPSNSRFYTCGTFSPEERDPRLCSMLLRAAARVARGLARLCRSVLHRSFIAAADPVVGARVASLNGSNPFVGARVANPVVGVRVTNPFVGARVASLNGSNPVVGARVASLNGSSDPEWDDARAACLNGPSDCEPVVVVAPAAKMMCEWRACARRNSAFKKHSFPHRSARLGFAWRSSPRLCSRTRRSRRARMRRHSRARRPTRRGA
jgi:hypothetical protein